MSSSKVLIRGAPAVEDSCKTMCALGGLITISDAGQGVVDNKPKATAVAAAAIAEASENAATNKENVPNRKRKDPDKENAKESKANQKPEEQTDSNENSEPDPHVQKKIDRAKRKVDNFKKHLTKDDLTAAWREQKGEVVAQKTNGTPWDHVDEVKNAQQGLKNTIISLKKILKTKQGIPVQRNQAEKVLSEASKLRDHSKGYLQ